MAGLGFITGEEMDEKAEIERLKALVIQGYKVVEDFMSNIGVCALQDYKRLNEFLIEAGKLAK